MLKPATYEDEEGRKWRRLLPDKADDSEACDGIPAGPPSFADLGLPCAIEIRLHNELYARGLFTEKDLTNRRAEVQHAIAAALRLDVERVHAIYHREVST